MVPSSVLLPSLFCFHTPPPFFFFHSEPQMYMNWQSLDNHHQQCHFYSCLFYEHCSLVLVEFLHLLPLIGLRLSWHKMCSKKFCFLKGSRNQIEWGRNVRKVCTFSRNCVLIIKSYSFRIYVFVSWIIYI